MLRTSQTTDTSIANKNQISNNKAETENIHKRKGGKGGREKMVMAENNEIGPVEQRDTLNHTKEKGKGYHGSHSGRNYLILGPKIITIPPNGHRPKITAPKGQG